jgi:hypothetical protein
MCRFSKSILLVDQGAFCPFCPFDELRMISTGKSAIVRG